jgi:hypothetical protein
MFIRLPALLLLLCALAACGAASDVEESGPPPTGSAGVVDSVFPMEVMLSRFRDGVPEPEALTGGTESAESLMEQVVGSLQARDTASFQALSIDLPVFAWLYFPTSVTARPPYELPPGMAWLQLQEENRKGLFRALRELGGRRLDYVGHQCAEAPVLEGENRIWTHCLLTLRIDDGKARPVRLFSSILERDGRFVVLSWANDF